MGKKTKKLPNTLDPTEPKAINHHNVPRTLPKGGFGVEVQLPLSPEEIAEKVRRKISGIRKSTVDKLCLMIDECYRISKRKNKSCTFCFEVSNGWAESFISRISGIRPLVLLRDLDLIEVIKPYRATIHPKANTYRFKIATFRSYEIILKGRTVEIYRQNGQRSKRRQKKDPIYSWIQQSLESIRLEEEDLSDYQGRSGHESAAAKFADGVRTQRWNRSSRWNNICQIPYDLRDRLIFEQDFPVIRLDISSSFAVMLTWLFRDDTEDAYRKLKISSEAKVLRNSEIASLTNFLSESDFYQKLLPNKPRKSAKAAFQRFLNSPELDPIAKQVGKDFNRQFQSCGRMIKRRRRAIRKKGAKSNLYFELFGRQNEIIKTVISRCREFSIFCIPVNDELIVPFMQGDQVREWIQQEIFLKTGVRASVGGHRYRPEGEDIP